jgi:hypothetical protein
MKKSTYDVVSTIAVVALVVFTVAAQHSGRAAYVFGVLAVLTAAGLFVAYIKASPDRASIADQATQAVEASQSKAESEAFIAAQEQALMRSVCADLYRKLFAVEREQASLVHKALYKKHLSERQLLLFLNAEHHGSTTHLKAGSYYTRVRFHRDPVHDPASIVANIVEKLCASSKEPRFEFILEPGGRFKIQQISAKHTSVIEPTAPKEEMVESSAEPEKSQLIN